MIKFLFNFVLVMVALFLISVFTLGELGIIPSGTKKYKHDVEAIELDSYYELGKDYVIEKKDTAIKKVGTIIN